MYLTYNTFFHQLDIREIKRYEEACAYHYDGYENSAAYQQAHGDRIARELERKLRVIAGEANHSMR